jgi:hypothetical protein
MRPSLIVSSPSSTARAPFARRRRTIRSLPASQSFIASVTFIRRRQTLCLSLAIFSFIDLSFGHSVFYCYWMKP